jgi:hypothetical protein
MFTSTLFVDNKASGNITLTLQKLRMLQIQGVKGEGVVHYCEPLTTKVVRSRTSGEMWHHRLSGRVNNRTKLFLSLDVTYCTFLRNL